MTKLQTQPMVPYLEGRGVSCGLLSGGSRSPPFKGRGQGWGLYLLLFMIAFAMTKCLPQRYKKSVKRQRLSAKNFSIFFCRRSGAEVQECRSAGDPGVADDTFSAVL